MTVPGLTLDRVIGQTCLHNSSLAVNSITGDVAYPAGCVVVIYQPRRNRQFRYFRVGKTVACLTFSKDGSMLAVGERGHQPNVIVWSLAMGAVIMELKGGHRFGISCIAFSPRGHLLVSAGFKYDKTLQLWDLEPNTPAAAGGLGPGEGREAYLSQSFPPQPASRGRRVASARVSQKVRSLAFSEDGTFFVTCGDKHVKYWYLDSQGNVPGSSACAGGSSVSTDENGSSASTTSNGNHTSSNNGSDATVINHKDPNTILQDLKEAEVGSRGDGDVTAAGSGTDGGGGSEGGVVVLEGRPASILEALRGSSFMDLACGKSSVYCVTSAGVLCVFSHNRVMERWLSLEATSASGLSVYEDDLLAVACSDGLLRLFNCKNLTYICTLPKPPPLGRANVSSIEQVQQLTATQAGNAYPATLGVRLSPSGTKVVAIYADRSFFIWDITDPTNVGKYRSFLNHSACIWDVQVIPAPMRRNRASEADEEEADGDANVRDDSNEADRDGDCLPSNVIATCSADNTVRLWDLGSFEPVRAGAGAGTGGIKGASKGARSRHAHSGSKGVEGGRWTNIYSKHLLRILYVASSDGEQEDQVVTPPPPPSSSASSAAMIPPSAGDGQPLPFKTGTGQAGADSSSYHLATAVPDTEIPPKPEYPGAPRSLAAHPDGLQLACGDKQGNIRVYSLADMRLAHTQPAHDAEVLCMAYSPVMLPLPRPATPPPPTATPLATASASDQQQQPLPLPAPPPPQQRWQAVQRFDVCRPLPQRLSDAHGDGGKSAATGGGDSGATGPLVLLASASRDRLVHIFDASPTVSPSTSTSSLPLDPTVTATGSGSGHPTKRKREGGDVGYPLVCTLENHSSSVTAIKFSYDGRRLVSAGGDKMLVINHVRGKQVARHKSISVPQGTIYGLDVDPTNKYMVTAGQDKRVNIWSIVNGRHTRGYKPEGANAELYKVDLDPAGVYAATCSFDKWIRLFDFYSGRCLAKVAGHSELVTGVRFSRDGRRLISIGGDGCIFIWRLSPDLQQAMKDRLHELYPQLQQEEVEEPIGLAASGGGGGPLGGMTSSSSLPTDGQLERSSTGDVVGAPANAKAKAKEDAKARLKFTGSNLPAWAQTAKLKGASPLQSQEDGQSQPPPHQTRQAAGGSAGADAAASSAVGGTAGSAGPAGAKSSATRQPQHGTATIAATAAGGGGKVEAPLPKGKWAQRAASPPRGAAGGVANVRVSDAAVAPSPSLSSPCDYEDDFEAEDAAMRTHSRSRSRSASPFKERKEGAGGDRVADVRVSVRYGVDGEGGLGGEYAKVVVESSGGGSDALGAVKVAVDLEASTGADDDNCSDGVGGGGSGGVGVGGDDDFEGMQSREVSLLREEARAAAVAGREGSSDVADGEAGAGGRSDEKLATNPDEEMRRSHSTAFFRQKGEGHEQGSTTPKRDGVKITVEMDGQPPPVLFPPPPPSAQEEEEEAPPSAQEEEEEEAELGKLIGSTAGGGDGGDSGSGGVSASTPHMREKRRETDNAVAQMRQRLAAMGYLGGEGDDGKGAKVSKGGSGAGGDGGGTVPKRGVDRSVEDDDDGDDALAAAVDVDDVAVEQIEVEVGLEDGGGDGDGGAVSAVRGNAQTEDDVVGGDDEEEEGGGGDGGEDEEEDDDGTVGMGAGMEGAVIVSSLQLKLKDSLSETAMTDSRQFDVRSSGSSSSSSPSSPASPTSSLPSTHDEAEADEEEEEDDDEDAHGRYHGQRRRHSDDDRVGAAGGGGHGGGADHGGRGGVRVTELSEDEAGRTNESTGSLLLPPRQLQDTSEALRGGGGGGGRRGKRRSIGRRGGGGGGGTGLSASSSLLPRRRQEYAEALEKLRGAAQHAASLYEELTHTMEAEGGMVDVGGDDGNGGGNGDEEVSGGENGDDDEFDEEGTVDDADALLQSFRQSFATVHDLLGSSSSGTQTGSVSGSVRLSRGLTANSGADIAISPAGSTPTFSVHGVDVRDEARGGGGIGSRVRGLGASALSASSSSTVMPIEVDLVLERYSDVLLGMFERKMEAVVRKAMTSSAGASIATQSQDGEDGGSANGGGGR